LQNKKSVSKESELGIEVIAILESPARYFYASFPFFNTAVVVLRSATFNCKINPLFTQILKLLNFKKKSVHRREERRFWICSVGCLFSR
jgi:hypothetical protein